MNLNQPLQTNLNLSLRSGDLTPSAVQLYLRRKASKSWPSSPRRRSFVLAVASVVAVSPLLPSLVNGSHLESGEEKKQEHVSIGFGSPQWKKTHEAAEKTAMVVTRLLKNVATCDCQDNHG
ncbi:unnamed protein product [Microthlaspi erraticum]|uniref:Uncharacterized protein n=1 Tax=Microthlaspi erraticum TaxID=1685480 RepID=A0A6D2HEX2_9BRAS|nr:unnamed protein product [Microthlaspi erraticum]